MSIRCTVSVPDSCIQLVETSNTFDWGPLCKELATEDVYT